MALDTFKPNALRENNNNYDGEIESSNSKSREERQELPVRNNYFNNDAMQNAEDIGPKKCHENTRPLKHTTLSLILYSIMLSLSARIRAVERLKENEQYNDNSSNNNANVAMTRSQDRK